MGTVGYLLDTHTLLWSARDEERLSSSARLIIEEANTPIFVSAVSAFEIMNKHRIGKLPEYTYVAEHYSDILHELGTLELPLTVQHAHYAGSFEWSHRDPFDRMLAAQSYLEELTLITNDPAFQSLPWVTVLW